VQVPQTKVNYPPPEAVALYVAPRRCALALTYLIEQSFDANTRAGNWVELAIIGFAIHTPETLVFDVSQTRTELKPQQPE
jgi:hypothetical protein